MDHLFTRIYALAVCFVTIICITITGGMALYEMVKVVNPELTLSPYQYQHLQTNETYRQTQFSPMTHARVGRISRIEMEAGASMAVPLPNQPMAKPPSDEEITRLREQQYNMVLSNERRSATASLIRLAIILIVSGPLFFVHWKLSQRYEAT
jgi:hypothetical protein